MSDYSCCGVKWDVNSSAFAEHQKIDHTEPEPFVSGVNRESERMEKARRSYGRKKLPKHVRRSLREQGL